jgi:hypothetical protein
VTKRASFAIKESLIFIKVGKVTFFCEKSLSCRYSALSLHSETVGKWPISDSFSRSASTLPSLWVRSAFALGSLCLRFGFAYGGEEKHKAMRQQRHGTNKRSLTDLHHWFTSLFIEEPLSQTHKKAEPQLALPDILL